MANEMKWEEKKQLSEEISEPLTHEFCTEKKREIFFVQ